MYCVGQWRIKNFVILIAYHRAELALVDELHSLDTKTRGEQPIHGCGRSSSLEMAENATARFFPGTLHNLVRYDLADTAKPVLADCGLLEMLFATLWPSALGHYDHRALITLRIPSPNGVSNVIPFEGNFGNQNDVCTARDSAE